MKITLNKATVYQIGKVRLLPGDNEVSGKDVHALLQNKIVQKDIAAGILTIEHEAAKAVAKPKVEAPVQPEAASEEAESADQIEAEPVAVASVEVAPVKRRGRPKKGA